MKIKLLVNWILFLTSFIWMPPFILIMEICLIPRMLSLPKEKRCETYRALFVGDEYWITMKQIREVIP